MAELFPNALPRPAEGADVAYTPDHVARALVEVLLPDLCGATIWEPYAGGGAFVRALAEKVRAIDPAVVGSELTNQGGSS